MLKTNRVFSVRVFVEKLTEIRLCTYWKSFISDVSLAVFIANVQLVLAIDVALVVARTCPLKLLFKSLLTLATLSGSSYTYENDDLGQCLAASTMANFLANFFFSWPTSNRKAFAAVVFPVGATATGAGHC